MHVNYGRPQSDFVPRLQIFIYLFFLPQLRVPNNPKMSKMRKCRVSMCFPPRPTAYLGDRKDSLPAGHHLVPLVMQHVHEAVRLVATHELRHVAG